MHKMKMAPGRHMGAQESVFNICIVNVISKLSRTKSKHIKLGFQIIFKS